jgi:hypothetical protein
MVANELPGLDVRQMRIALAAGEILEVRNGNEKA